MRNPTRSAWTVLLTTAIFAIAAGEPPPTVAEQPVILASQEWQLAGTWRAADREPTGAAVLLLHRATGSQAEHEALAEALAGLGISSLRLDLRAHGDSDNQGRFEEPYGEHRHLLEGTETDVRTALDWLADRPEVDPQRLGVVAASYSGEMVGLAVATGARAVAFAMLSPGSFSDASIDLVDPSGAAWLFVRTEEESPVSLPHIDAVYQALAERSKRAEVWTLPGAGHATRIFDEHPELVGRLAEWLAGRLAAATP